MHSLYCFFILFALARCLPAIRWRATAHRFDVLGELKSGQHYAYLRHGASDRPIRTAYFLLQQFRLNFVGEWLYILSYVCASLLYCCTLYSWASYVYTYILVCTNTFFSFCFVDFTQFSVKCSEWLSITKNQYFAAKKWWERWERRARHSQVDPSPISMLMSTSKTAGNYSLPMPQVSQQFFV